MEGEGDLDAAELLALASQDPLHTVVPIGQPVGQIHVGQEEVRLRQRVQALKREASKAFWVRRAAPASGSKRKLKNTLEMDLHLWSTKTLL